jgi:hypothetical protein
VLVHSCAGRCQMGRRKVFGCASAVGLLPGGRPLGSVLVRPAWCCAELLPQGKLQIGGSYASQCVGGEAPRWRWCITWCCA